MFFTVASPSNRALLTVFTPALILVAALFCSCTSTTGTKIRLDQPALQKIESIGVLVKQDQDFSVLIDRQRPSTLGHPRAGGDPLAAAVCCLIYAGAAGVEAATRASADQKIEQKLRLVADKYDVKKVIEEKLTQYLRSADLFTRVDPTATEDRRELQKEGFDGVLKVTLKQWGLRLCDPSPTSHNVQLGFNLHEKLLLQDGTVIWERGELYLDLDCRPWMEIEAEPKLLEQVLTRSSDDLAGRIVNEIRFPRRTQKGASP